jgi:hypothetical protein
MAYDGLPGVLATILLGHQVPEDQVDPIWDRNSDLEVFLADDRETVRSIDTWSRIGLEELCVGCCCISANFSGRRNADRKISDRFPDRIRPECCESEDRTDCRNDPERWEVP